MTFKQAKSELMQIYGALSPDKQRAIDTLVKIEPCEDAISRQAVSDAMYELCGEGSLKDNPWRDNPHIDSIIETIEDLPSVTPQKPKTETWSIKEVADALERHGLFEQEPKTGHWIRWYEQQEDNWVVENIPHCKCSECGEEYNPHSSQFIKYCPNCGCRMVEPQESEAAE